MLPLWPILSRQARAPQLAVPDGIAHDLHGRDDGAISVVSVPLHRTRRLLPRQAPGPTLAATSTAGATRLPAPRQEP
ncbi:MAG TPA: hypothetical protein VKH18_06670 [Terriglobales bacterium]|nr:hypothetical protein [Terriglobales bacterium]